VANEAHVAASVIADAVTLLSGNWNDIRSFATEQDANTRKAISTSYRVGIISGKTLAFPKPGWAGSSFGSDGGAHNFMRNLEDWDASATGARSSASTRAVRALDRSSAATRTSTSEANGPGPSTPTS
jgi:hypothetical protein